jgi:hypothetical protein
MIDVGTTSDMTLAVLSFETRKSPARVRFRCYDLHIDERPDGRRTVVRGLDRSRGQCAQVWDLQEGAYLLTHRANGPYLAIATTATAIIASDVWFLEWPSPDAKAQPKTIAGLITRPLRLPDPEHPAQRPPMKHTILFLAANPLGTDRVALDREARAIQVELERSGFRDRFELVTRWAAEPLDLLRELRKL